MFFFSFFIFHFVLKIKSLGYSRVSIRWHWKSFLCILCVCFISIMIKINFKRRLENLLINTNMNRKWTKFKKEISNDCFVSLYCVNNIIRIRLKMHAKQTKLKQPWNYHFSFDLDFFRWYCVLFVSKKPLGDNYALRLNYRLILMEPACGMP